MGAINLRLPRAVITAFVTTAVAGSGCLRTDSDEVLAEVAVTAYTHPRWSVYQISSALLALLCEDDFSGWRVIVAGNYWRHFLVLLDQNFPPCPGCLLLSLGLLWWVASAFLAANVLALSTFVTGAEGCAALVALAVDSHARRLVDTEYVSFN